MKKQTPHTPDSSEFDNDEEITFKKTSPLTDEPSEEAPEAPQNYQALFEELTLKFEEVQKEHLLKWAEMENFKKRLAKEKDDFIKFSNEGLLEELLPCLDNLALSVQHATEEQLKSDPVISGVGFVLKQFLGTLEKYGLKEVGTENEPFNPHWHEAIETVAKENTASGLVIKVHRKGYTLSGRLLRAALVSVSA